MVSGKSPFKNLIFRNVRIDAKGRISIPSDIRRNFGLDSGSEISIAIDLRKNIAFLIFGNGRDGVKAGTEAREASSTGSSPGHGLFDRKKGVNYGKRKRF